MKLRPEDPMRTRATDNGVEDGWRGARIGAETRDRQRRAVRHIPAEIDLGEPEPPRVTIAFLVLTLLVTAWEFATFGVSPTTSELARAGGSGIGAVATGAWWKLLVANVLHANLLHIAMNAFVIYLMGRWLEHLAGRLVVATTIAWSALLASVGAVYIDVAPVTIGASGVAFGLVGCAVAIDPRARTATGVIARQLAIVNIIGTFLIPGISIGGHLGGLVGGLLVGALCWRRTADEQHPAGRARRTATAATLAASLPLVAICALGPTVLPNDAARLRGEVVAPLLARQLSGSTLTSGLEIGGAACERTADPLRYTCTIDTKDHGEQEAAVRFSRVDDQWSLSMG